VNRTICAILLGALSLAPGAAARAQSNANEPQTWKMTVHAAALPRPALKYALVPDAADLSPGNAGPLYLMAMAAARRVPAPEFDADDLARKGLPPAESDDLLYYYASEVPLDKLPVGDVEAFLAPYRDAMRLFDVAARRQDCQWELRVREMGLDMPLSHLNDARHLANVASVRFRLQAARGQYAEAAQTARAIFQFGRDIGDEGMLVQGLVGVGVGAVGVERVRGMMERRDAPNLYWALARLPRPFADLGRNMQWERAQILSALPQLKKLRDDGGGGTAGEPFTADDWRGVINGIMSMTSGGAQRESRLEDVLRPAGAGAMMYPHAKHALIERGLSAEQVEAMPVPEVLGRYVAGEYDAWFDDMTKWASLPYWQGRSGMAAVEQAFARRTQSVSIGWMKLLMPSLSRAAFNFASLDRQVAALQTIEALRAYAAAHDGKLPATLEELATLDVPAPIDPTTGKPFAYTIEGNRATLESAAPPGESPRSGLRVEVTVVK
jgi:hypothetical protein